MSSRDEVLARIAQWVPLNDEIIARLDTYVTLLKKWNNAYNLVGRSTLDDSWRRHVLDGAQLWPHVSRETQIIDFGSGAGVPGIILALLGAENVHLVESNQKKCLFLEEARRQTASSFEVHQSRIEALDAWPVDVITCRAFASFEDILDYSEPFLTKDTRMLLLKGDSWPQEEKVSRETWDFLANATPSAVQEKGESAGLLVEITEIRKR